ncbi:MAG: FMN-binding protein [Oscillospiraceae bacterium]|nr:FMN-binding protein [Oscillospiraceae bacterium]
MKRLLAICLIFVLALALAACGAPAEKVTYTAEAAEASHGYKDTVTVTFEGDKVTDATFESYQEDGSKKSEASPEDYPMTPAPSEWIPQLSENIKKAKTAEEIEAVAGATYGSNNAKALYAAILKAKEDGADASQKIIVDLGEE